MKNGNNDIHLLEQQMANNEDICCSCGNITSFPRAFFVKCDKIFSLRVAIGENLWYIEGVLTLKLNYYGKCNEKSYC